MNESVLLCIRNGLMLEGILKMFHERKENLKVTSERNVEFFVDLVKMEKPDVVVIEVKDVPLFSLVEWNDRFSEIKKILPTCKIAMIIDDENYPDMSMTVQNEKINGNIEAFFYASSGLVYLVDAISCI